MNVTAPREVPLAHTREPRRLRPGNREAEKEEKGQPREDQHPDRQQPHPARVLCDGPLHGDHVSPHELVDGNAEQLAEQKQALHVRVSLVVLPIRNGLARHEDRFRNLVLGKPALLPLGLQLPSQFHRSLPFGCPLARRVACTHRNDTPQALQNDADTAVKSLLQGF